MSHRVAFLVGILGIHGILVYVPTGILLRKSSDAELFRRTMLTWKKWFGVRCGSREVVTTQEKLDHMSSYLGNDREKEDWWFGHISQSESGLSKGGVY